jgi:hypothetical protein
MKYEAREICTSYFVFRANKLVIFLPLTSILLLRNPKNMYVTGIVYKFAVKNQATCSKK